MDYNDEILHDLVRGDDNIEAVRNVLAKEKDPNLTNSLGDTLLHIAAGSIHDNPIIVQELINAGADVCRLDNLSFTALHFAATLGKQKVVDVLLQTEIPINHKNYLGVTALHYAMNENIKRLFKKPVPETNIYIVRKLLDHRLINVNETDINKQTSLVWAIKNNQFEVVKLLLNKNARVDISDSFTQTPLHHALFCRNHRIAVALLLEQASLLESDGDGQTPLDNIINFQSVEFACKCLEVIAFKYNLKEFFTKKVILNPQLWEYLSKCWKEIENMKNDIIVSELTVFDFFSKCDAKPGFQNPIFQIYKPVVKKLLNGAYPVYLGYVLNRMSKSTLYAVLEVYINEKYDTESCAMDHFAIFLKIIQIRLLFEYLSNEQIFCLIDAFINKSESKYLQDFQEHEWYLTDLWDVYPDDHFC